MRDHEAFCGVLAYAAMHEKMHTDTGNRNKVYVYAGIGMYRSVTERCCLPVKGNHVILSSFEEGAPKVRLLRRRGSEG